jgi:hypothetical protein
VLLGGDELHDDLALIEGIYLFLQFTLHYISIFLELLLNFGQFIDVLDFFHFLLKDHHFFYLGFKVVV